ncbi:MAG: hypothetical protein Q6364_12025 [Candidatus Hermodarchaeota archaeon]|nr:hypothetical protein [Candidatus Hermodarchaeota archaeon]
MASPSQTGRKSEVLWALPYVVSLAQDVLSGPEYIEAETTAVYLVRTKQLHDAAMKRLIGLVAPPPKHPLSEAQEALKGLPRFTRGAIQYLGEYIELLVRAWCFELTGDAASKSRSLGANIRRLKPKKLGTPEELVDQLQRYNSFLYTPAKHDFTIFKGQRHRFTAREAVLVAYITMKLAERIMELSSAARLQAIAF